MKRFSQKAIAVVMTICALHLTISVSAQVPEDSDIIFMDNDSTDWSPDDRILADTLLSLEDSEGLLLADTIFVSSKRDWSSWRPDTKRALWLAIVLPGAGQIYNRKFWKLPIVYGGFVGCAYAMRWNNMMYHDYSQAYLDLMDDDPQTQSYNQFMHLGAKITDANISRYVELINEKAS